MRNRIEVFLEDFTYNTRFEFLEESKDKTELEAIAAKRGIRFPSHDLSIFKGRYAYVDRMNLNNCTLPKEEVELALDTLNGKAIDFDHYRKNVVGHWIDAKLEGDEIIAYGVFFKGNFMEDYSTIQELMEQDVLAISMEAWGNREIKEDGSYSLSDIEFAGGALLIKTKPAAPGSEVLEMSNRGKILEMAKILTPPASFIHTGELFKDKVQEVGKIVFPATNSKVNDNKDHFPINDVDQAKNALVRAAEYTTAPKWYDGPLSEVVAEVKNTVKNEYPNIKVSEDLPEIARFYLYDIESMVRMMSEVDCVNCNEKGFSDIEEINFKNNYSNIKCINCDTEMKVDLTPMAKLTKKGRKIKKIEEIKDMDKINHDSAQVNAGVNIDNVETDKIKEEEQSMKKLMEKYKVDSVQTLVQTLAKESLKRELSEDELAFAYTVIEYKAGGGTVNDTSLIALKGKSVANPVSLVAASITEEDITTIIAEITKAEKVDLTGDAPVVEEPVVEEPVVEEPAVVEPVVVEPVVEEPVVVEPVVEEPVVEEPVVVEPVVEEPVVEEPTAEAKLLAEIAELKAKVETYEKAQKEADEKAKLELIKSRRDELGKFGEKLSDEEILTNDKFTIAKQTKVIEMMKDGKDVTKEIATLELSKGSVDKEVISISEADTRKRIRDLAWSSIDDNDKEED